MIKTIIGLFIFSISTLVFSQNEENFLQDTVVFSGDTEELLVGEEELAKETEVEEAFNMEEMILHHIQDAHEFHVFTTTNKDGSKKDISVPLPVILIDGGLQVFSSNKLYKEGVKYSSADRHDYLVNEDLGYALYNEKIYKLDENNQLSFNEAGEVTNVRPVDLSISKNVFALLLTAIFLLVILSAAARSYDKEGTKAPKGIAKFVEPIVIFVRDDIAKQNIGEEKYKRYMPYLLCVFFFIWVNSLFGLIPIFPGSTNVTGNISFTLTLAVFTLLITVLSGSKQYWGHVLSPPVPKLLYIIMIPIEIIGIFTKPFALTIRLFANMSAGHIIIMAFIGIIFTFQSVAWSGLSVPMALFINVLELLVGLLQAFIFTVLSALFIGEAVAEH